MITQSQMVEAVKQCLPYPDQIVEWNLSRDNQVRFLWRNTRVVISMLHDNGEFVNRLMVEEGSDPPGFLSGSAFTLVFERLLEAYMLEAYTRTVQEVEREACMSFTFKALVEVDQDRGVLYVHNADTKLSAAKILPTVIRISRLPKGFSLEESSLDIDYHSNKIGMAI